jgi:hypothetical protein
MKGINLGSIDLTNDDDEEDEVVQADDEDVKEDTKPHLPQSDFGRYLDSLNEGTKLSRHKGFFESSKLGVHSRKELLSMAKLDMAELIKTVKEGVGAAAAVFLKAGLKKELGRS